MNGKYNPAIVFDHGTGFTKMGFATSISETAVVSPWNDGMISEDTLELLWHESFYKHLRADPRDHYLLLSEGPFYGSEGREKFAEILFESFGVPALNFIPSSILALSANSESNKDMTGLVIDCGYTTTSITPIVDGYVISEAVEHLKLGGRDIDFYIQSAMRERKEPIPSAMSLEISRFLKENYMYICPCPLKESERYHSDPTNFIKQYKGTDKSNGKPFECNTGLERFLAPELLANPQFHKPEFNASLADLVYASVQKCPIDTKRRLFGNIILSGGSSSFQGFNKRLQKDLKYIVEKRIVASRMEAGIIEAEKVSSDIIKINVMPNSFGIGSNFVGGCILAASSGFHDSCITKELYDEEGPRLVTTKIMRTSI